LFSKVYSPRQISSKFFSPYPSKAIMNEYVSKLKDKKCVSVNYLRS